jgi:hypothetical protein
MPTSSRSTKAAKASRPATNERDAQQATAVKATPPTPPKPPARRATQDGTSEKDKRQLVQERKILNSQSRWLQKALFALTKAEDDQEKLAEVRGDEHVPMAVTVDGATHELGAVTDSLRDSVMERLEGLRVTLRDEHSLMGG